MEVFAVFSRCSVQRRLGELNILFPVTVLMVYAQTRVQLRLGEQNTFIIKICSPGQSLTAVRRDGGPGGGPQDLVVVLKTLSQDKVQQRLVEQMMLKTSSGAPQSYWSTPAVSTR